MEKPSVLNDRHLLQKDTYSCVGDMMALPHSVLVHQHPDIEAPNVNAMGMML